jgi:hypothetical protein
MSDRRIRELEQAAALGGVNEQAALLVARIRAQQLRRNRVLIAAELGDEASRLALDLGDEPRRGYLPIERWQWAEDHPILGRQGWRTRRLVLHLYRRPKSVNVRIALGATEAAADRAWRPYLGTPVLGSLRGTTWDEWSMERRMDYLLPRWLLFVDSYNEERPLDQDDLDWLWTHYRLEMDPGPVEWESLTHNVTPWHAIEIAHEWLHRVVYTDARAVAERMAYHTHFILADAAAYVRGAPGGPMVHTLENQDPDEVLAEPDRVLSPGEPAYPRTHPRHHDITTHRLARAYYALEAAKDLCWAIASPARSKEPRRVASMGVGTANSVLEAAKAAGWPAVIESIQNETLPFLLE